MTFRPPASTAFLAVFGLALAPKSVRPTPVVLVPFAKVDPLIASAQGGLSASRSVVRRMQELAVESGGGGVNAEQRKALDARFKEELQRLDVVAESAAFGDLVLLDGSVDVDLQGPLPAALTKFLDLPCAHAEGLGLANKDLGISTQRAALQAQVALDEAIQRLAAWRVEIAAAPIPIHY